MRLLKILYIEDSEEGALLFGRACNAAGVPAQFCTVQDGFAAVSYLEGDGKFADRSAYPLPDIVVLELKLPRMDGFDFLKWVRRKTEFLCLPVLVFTSSTSIEDKVRAIQEGATGYFIKPKNFDALVRMAESFRKIVTNGSDKK